MTNRFAFFFIVLCCFMGHVQAAQIPLDRVVAIVNEDVITALTLDDKTNEVLKQLRAKGQTLPPRDVLEKEILQQIIARRLQIQTAENTGIRISDDEVNQTLFRLAQNNGMVFDRFKQQVENEGVSFADFRQQVREEIIISRLRERDINRYVQVTDKEIDRFMVTERESFFGDNEYRVAHLLVSIPTSSTPDVIKVRHAEAAQLLKKINAGENLLAVLSKNSFRAYGNAVISGGDLGWKKLKELPGIFAEKVVTLQPQEVSEVFVSDRGLHIVQLLGYKRKKTIVSQQVRFSRLSLKATVLEGDAAVREALTLYAQRANNTNTFEGLAADFLQQHAKASFDALAWHRVKDLTLGLANKLAELNLGDISQPFQLNGAWSVVRLLDRKKEDITAQGIRDKARELIFRKKTDEKGKHWLQQLLDGAYIDVRL